MQIKERQSFKSLPLYDLTAKVQNNTLLNRGLIELGGCGVPHVIMSNTKEERIERTTGTLLYFGTSFLTPFIMLPFFNKRFLKSNNIIKDFKNNEKRILEVSKEYLNKDANHMVKGIRETAQKIIEEVKETKDSKEILKTQSIVQDFENLLNRYKDKEELRQKLLKVHDSVYTSDFLTTGLMWCATPWIFTGITELYSHKKGYSAAYNLVEQKQVDEKEYKKNKYKKMLATVVITLVPAIIAPKIVTKAIRDNHDTLAASKNIFKKNTGKFLNMIKRNASNFDYTEAMFMSKTIFALMWLLGSYPVNLVSARDKYEVKDRAIRNGALLTMYFGGDFLINNVTGRVSDKFFGTKIMDTDNMKKGAGFFERFKLSPRNFKKLKSMKNIDPQILQKTKTTGAALYWISLLSNMALIGFAVPSFLNKFLRASIKKDVQNNRKRENPTPLTVENLPEVFMKFGQKVP